MSERKPWMVSGNVASGCAVPMRGAAYGLGVDTVAGGFVRVGWKLSTPKKGYGSERAEFLDGSQALEVWRDGVHERTLTAGERTHDLIGLRPGESVAIGLGPVSKLEAGTNPGELALFARREAGNRVCLEWADQPSDADFESYVIYWDEGDGMGADTELAVIGDLEQLTFVTGELEAGTYVFAIAYRDRTGNESSAGSTVSVDVGGVPEAVTELAASYSSSTRKVTLSWTNATQPSDVRRLVVTDNAGWGGDSELANHAGADVGEARALLPTSDTSWESGNLWEGTWKFAVRALREDGVLGPAVEVELTLALSGSTLVEEVDPPEAPVLVRLERVAGAKYKATWETGDTTGVSEWRVVQDGSEVATVAAGTLEWTSGALSDGTEYEVKVRAYNTAGTVDVYRESNAVSVTVDGSAPSGDGVLTGRACV